MKMSSEEFLKYIKGYVLECVLCKGQLKQPKSLPCLHVFCRECIRRYIDDNIKHGFYDCPTCKESHGFSPEGLGSLRDASLQKSLLEIVSIFEKKAIPCSACDTGKSATTACIKCGNVFCTTCEGIHKRFGTTREHAITLIEELDNVQKFYEFQKNRYDMCLLHESESSKLYCVEDRVGLCKLCTYEPKHRKHDIIPMIVKLQELKGRIKEINVDIESKTAELNKQKELIQDILAKVNNEEIQALEILQHRVTEVSDMMQKYEKRVSDKIKSRCSARQDYLNKQLEVIEGAIHENKLCVDKSGLLDVLPAQCALDVARDIIKQSGQLPDVMQMDDQIWNVPSNEFIASTLDSTKVVPVFETVIGVNSDSTRRYEPYKITRASLSNTVSTLATEIVQEALWEYRNMQRYNSYDKIAERCVRRLTEVCKGKWNCLVATVSHVGYCTNPMKEILLSIAGLHVHIFEN